MGRRTTIGRIEDRDGQRPKLDGWLDEACWQNAEPIGELVQVEPIQGIVPGQRTDIRLLHDARNLYFGIRCFDDTPREIRATQRARDADLDPDDRIECIIDPFGDGQLAYFFQVGAAGSIGDALMTANSFTKSWDTIWDGRVQVTDEGWQAELEIPFLP